MAATSRDFSAFPFQHGGENHCFQPHFAGLFCRAIAGRCFFDNDEIVDPVTGEIFFLGVSMADRPFSDSG